QIDSEIRDNLLGFFKDKSLPVKLITMTVGKANPPDAIRNQRIETAAEEQRRAAEQSRADADNAYRESMHLSPEQFIQLKAIEMQSRVCGPEGKAGCTFIQNGGATPVYNLG